VKIAFWGIDQKWKDFVSMQIPTFGLKNALTKFQKVMHQILASLDFSKWYIDDIVVFGSTMEEYGHHLKMCLNAWGHMG